MSLIFPDLLDGVPVKHSPRWDIRVEGGGRQGLPATPPARRLHGTDKVAVPLTSLVIFILGHGLFNTLLTVRLSAEQVSARPSVWVSAAYFGGLVLGTLHQCLIIRVGHIRAYAAYASPALFSVFCCTAWWWSLSPGRRCG